MTDGLVVSAEVPGGTVGRPRVVDERTVEVEVQSSREFGIEGALETWVRGSLSGHRDVVEVRVVNEHGNMQFLRPVVRLPGSAWQPVGRFGIRACGASDVFAFDVPAAGGAAVDFATWWPYELDHQRALLDDLAASDAATVTEAGQTVNGRPLYAVTIAEEAPTCTLAITSGFHGGEPSGLWAADALLRFAFSPAAAPLRRWLRIVAVPGVNLDAIAEGLDRRNAGGLNLWLDAEASSAPEVVAVDGVLRHVRPDAILDLHSWHWTGDGCFTPGWLSAGDALYGQVLRLRAAIDQAFPLGGQLFFTDDEACWLVRAGVEHGVPAIGVEVSLSRGSDGAWKTVDRARQDGVAILRGAAAYLAAATGA